MSCGYDRRKIELDFDGELDPAGSLELAAHERECPECRARRAELETLRSLLQSPGLRADAPDTLRKRVRQIAAPAPKVAARYLAAAAAVLIAFGLGFLSARRGAGGGIAGDVVAAHIRSLEAQHLVDVVSSDRHTVRPWFTGKIDFSPPVADFKNDGFDLIGGRLDYLGGRPAAALVYRHGLHTLNVFLWPDDGAGETSIADEEVRGYHLASWGHAGFRGWVVSDAAPEEVAVLAKLVRGSG